MKMQRSWYNVLVCLLWTAQFNFKASWTLCDVVNLLVWFLFTFASAFVCSPSDFEELSSKKDPKKNSNPRFTSFYFILKELISLTLYSNVDSTFSEEEGQTSKVSEVLEDSTFSSANDSRAVIGTRKEVTSGSSRTPWGNRTKRKRQQTDFYSQE